MDPYTDDRARREEWTAAECARILYRHKGTVAWITLLAVLAAGAITALQPHEYQSRASVEIRNVNDGFLDMRGVNPLNEASADAPGSMQTQVEILQQDNLLEQMARTLNLDQRPEYRSAPNLLARLRDDIRIAPVKNSHIIQIIVDARTPALAADMANTLAAAYIEQNITERQTSARQTYEALLQQLGELRHSRVNRATGAADEGVDKHFYDATLQKAYNAWLASRIRLSNVRLAGMATAPMFPSKPSLPLNLAIGLIGGLLAAVAYVMLCEQSKPVLRMPGDAGSFLSLPELGAIPQAGGWAPLAALFPGAANGRRAERAALEQRTELSESFRTTVASILSNGHNGGGPRVLVVTSSLPTEGKTTVVSNLGIALAAASKKVLMIDGDMRRPRLHKLFDEANSWGLSDVLNEKNAIDELPLDVLAKRTSVPHLYLLPSGASTENIFGLLYSGRMSRLLPLFREQFDYVLVDAPPCLEFSDARIMARYAEEVLLVVRANHTDRRTAQTAVRRLRLDGTQVMGVILNRWNPSPGDRYLTRGSWTPGQRGVN